MFLSEDAVPATKRLKVLKACLNPGVVTKYPLLSGHVSGEERQVWAVPHRGTKVREFVLLLWTFNWRTFHTLLQAFLYLVTSDPLRFLRIASLIIFLKLCWKIQTVHKWSSLCSCSAHFYLQMCPLLHFWNTFLNFCVYKQVLIYPQQAWWFSGHHIQEYKKM